jgi:hypothetical protein
MHLQKRSPAGKLSTSAKILAPVVVNPDIASKKASVREDTVPVKMYGKAPKKVTLIHDSVTAMKDSLYMRSTCLYCFVRASMTEPENNVTRKEMLRAKISEELFNTDTPTGTSIKIDRIMRMIPTILKTVLKFM